jgi:hypothetical protein
MASTTPANGRKVEASNADSKNANPLALSADEMHILTSQIDQARSKDGYGAIYRYASRSDAIVMLLAIVAACGGGTCLPLMIVSPCLHCHA